MVFLTTDGSANCTINLKIILWNSPRLYLDDDDIMSILKVYNKNRGIGGEYTSWNIIKIYSHSHFIYVVVTIQTLGFILFISEICDRIWEVKEKVEVYSFVPTLQRSHTTSHLLSPGHWVCSCKCHLNSMGSIQVMIAFHSFTYIHGLPSQVPVYTPEWKEAIKIKHSAQECKHDDPARIRTRDP